MAAIKSNQEASSSSFPSSSLPTHGWTYDVFLSFRGKDTRKNFIDHLYFALNQKGINTFKDDEKLPRGKSIAPELLKAIEESRFSIVVLSENYASSSWCLDELVKIVECNKKMGQTVLPVFFDVDPSQVRRQTGKFGEGFARHGDKADKVKLWKDALVEVGNFFSWDLKNVANGHQAKCIQEIVEELLSRLNCTTSADVQTLVGIEPRMEEVNTLLATDSNDVRIVGVWGMSGIGKTTLARAVFDRVSHQFEGSCFLSEVREVSKKHDLQHLQNKLLSEILLLRNLQIRNVYEGINIIKRRLRYKKVLLVLDDVDHIDQLDALAGSRDWFGIGSRIIITTRDKHLLVGHEVDSIYKVSALNDKEATQLFCWKAFKKSNPAEDYKELSYNVVQYASGLPLALKILGSSLRGRGMREWISTVERLRDVPEDEILEKLKISYDGLKDVEREIFLDIACFFKGEKVESVARILDSFGFYPDIGLCVLIEKSLIDVSNNRLQMHDLIQEMGWHIIRKLHPKEPGRQSRLWLPDDVFYVLTENMGTEAVEGIVLDLTTAQHVSIGDESFKKMKNLRLLKIRNMYLSRGLEHLPNGLRWLDWHGYESKSLPTDFLASRLVGLKMCHSRVIQLWKGIKVVDKLVFIKLSHSHKLTRTPDFTGIPNLERLVLEDCTSLIEVHPSIASHKKLRFLSLKDCKSLKYLPSSVEMESLKILILSGCVKIGKFPEIHGPMGCLSRLYLERTAIKELPSSIEHLRGLVLIDLTDCGNLTSLPSSICSLTGLRFLTLSGCSKLDKLPENLGNMECLEVLRGDRTAITQPPPSIVSLKKLKVLSFSGCRGATSQSWSSLFLSRLRQGTCQEYTSFMLPSVLGLCSLTKLDLSDCNLFDGGIPSDLGCLSSLKNLNLSRNNFATLPTSISRLSYLKILALVGCKRLEVLPELPSNIVKLYADDCTSLKGIEDMLMKYKLLWTVSLTNCIELFDNMGGMLWQCLLQFISTRRLLQRPASIGKFSIMIPGRKIPECFRYQGVGDLILMDLPRNWYNSNFMGFALCCVVESISATPEWDFVYKYKIPTIHMGMDFVNYDQKNQSQISLIFRISTIGTDKIVDSEHVCLVYVVPDSIWSTAQRESNSPNNYSRFEAYFSHSIEEQLLLKKWGVRLVYEEDLEQKDQLWEIQSSSHCGNPENAHNDRSMEEVAEATEKRKQDDYHDNKDVADATFVKRIRDDD